MPRSTESNKIVEAPLVLVTVVHHWCGLGGPEGGAPARHIQRVGVGGISVFRWVPEIPPMQFFAQFLHSQPPPPPGKTPRADGSVYVLAPLALFPCSPACVRLPTALPPACPALNTCLQVLDSKGKVLATGSLDLSGIPEHAVRLEVVLVRARLPCPCGEDGGGGLRRRGRMQRPCSPGRRAMLGHLHHPAPCRAP